MNLLILVPTLLLIAVLVHAAARDRWEAAHCLPAPLRPPAPAGAPHPVEMDDVLRAFGADL